MSTGEKLRNTLIGVGLALVLVFAGWVAMRGDEAPAGSAPLPDAVLSPEKPAKKRLPARSGKQPSAAPGTSSQSTPGVKGSGAATAPGHHRIVLTVGSDSPIRAIGWKMPAAIGKRGGKDMSAGTSYTYTGVVVGKPLYAQLYAQGSSRSSYLWCKITVDGKVTISKRAGGPWGEVMCLG